jgi:DNA-binding MarR family transcriptional regulator
MRLSLNGLSAVDRIVHEPARLAILTVLDACRCADYRQLACATALAPANLSAHLTKLQAVGFIEIVKSFRGRRSHTEVHLTMAGEYAIRQHWTCLEEARQAADAWRNRTDERAPPVGRSSTA